MCAVERLPCVSHRTVSLCHCRVSHIDASHRQTRLQNAETGTAPVQAAVCRLRRGPAAFRPPPVPRSLIVVRAPARPSARPPARSTRPRSPLAAPRATPAPPPSQGHTAPGPPRHRLYAAAGSSAAFMPTPASPRNRRPPCASPSLEIEWAALRISGTAVAAPVDSPWYRRRRP